jgi:hypothetical protein
MAVQESSDSGGRILTQRLRQTQLVEQHKVAKSAAQRGEVVRPTAVIHTHYEFGKSKRHFLNRSQESEVRSQNRNSKLEIRNSKTVQQVIPA